MTDDSNLEEARMAWQNQPSTALRIPVQAMRTRVEDVDHLMARATLALLLGGTASVPALAWLLYTFTNPIERIGTVLCVIGVVFLIYQVRSHIVSSREAADVVDTRPSVDAYRAVLERQREFYRGVWMWSRLIALFPGLLIFMLGALQADPGDLETIVTIGVIMTLAVGMVVHNLSMARRYQREIDEIRRLQSA